MSALGSDCICSCVGFLLHVPAAREHVQLTLARLTHSRFGLQVINAQRGTHVMSGTCSGLEGVSCIVAGHPAWVKRLCVCKCGAVQGWSTVLMCDQTLSPAADRCLMSWSSGGVELSLFKVCVLGRVILSDLSVCSCMYV